MENHTARDAFLRPLPTAWAKKESTEEAAFASCT